MNNKEVLNLKFTQEDISVNLELSDNFNTEHPIFEELAFYLGALEYNHQKDSPSIHLTTLEKLEILCKKARLIGASKEYLSLLTKTLTSL
jgi:hypothetical protein